MVDDVDCPLVVSFDLRFHSTVEVMEIQKFRNSEMDGETIERTRRVRTASVPSQTLV